MRTEPRVIFELRSLFLRGATPSRLIQHIAARHASQDNLYSLLQAYFREAFSTALIRVSPELLLRDPQALDLAFLNVHLLHEMILNRSEWGSENEVRGEVSSWLDDLQASSDSALIDSVHPEAVPELANSWALLDEDARRYLRRAFGNAQALQERVTILAQLAEQLQQMNLAQEEGREKDDAKAALTHTPHA